MPHARNHSDLPASADVVVIGAGLAGLAAAQHLTRSGRDVIVVEASDAPGGRIRTDVVDGFRLDRGFQLYNPAYPEGARMFDHEDLDLRGFERGAIIASGGRRFRLGDPRAHPGWVVDALRAPTGGPLALARFAAYAVRCATVDPRVLTERQDGPSRTVLASAGVNSALMTSVVQPFLAGVFLEEELTTSRRFADLILRSFVRGTPSVPAAGMQALPEQLARDLPTLHLNTSVTAVEPGRVTTDRGTVTAGAVVVAVGPGQVPALLPGRPAPQTRSCTTWYHVPDQPPGDLAFGQALLTLDADHAGPVVNSAVMTHAAPSYAPPGASLVASTAVGLHPDLPESVVRGLLARMYGVPTDRWQLVARYDVPDALPAMVPPLNVRQSVVLGDGMFIAGDHRDTASIQGALVSGRRAATAVGAHLAGVR